MVFAISACHSMKIGILYVQTPIDEKDVSHPERGKKICFLKHTRRSRRYLKNIMDI